ncbi:MAG: pilus assembly protein [Enterococcus sp.]|nr:pilus assembly protein [Enterococcus sp.]
MLFMEKIRRIMNKREETGAADLIVTLVTIPFAVMLILATLDIGMYMNTRAFVDSTTRDSARQVAMWGGAGGPADVRLNPTKQTTTKNLKDKLWSAADGYCYKSHCTKQPTVTCSPSITRTAGTEVYCEVTYYYKSIVPGASLLGFGEITEQPFTTKATAISETGYR